jgi:hypothetical protein
VLCRLDPGWAGVGKHGHEPGCLLHHRRLPSRLSGLALLRIHPQVGWFDTVLRSRTVCFGSGAHKVSDLLQEPGGNCEPEDV